MKENKGERVGALYKLVFLRHGESEWNKENRFTGWVDVGLSGKGGGEAKEAGETLKKEKFSFDIVFTSILKRAVDTTTIVLKELHLEKIPVEKTWRLNERHYGALQGLNEKERTKQGEDPLFASLSESELPATECLKDTYARVLPYWEKEIAPAIRKNKRVLVSAHGNSIRALVKYLDGISDEEISELNIPTGVPLVYELDDSLKPVRHYYLGDADAIQKKMDAVKNQAKVSQKH